MPDTTKFVILSQNRNFVWKYWSFCQMYERPEYSTKNCKFPAYKCIIKYSSAAAGVQNVLRFHGHMTADTNVTYLNPD